MEEQRYPTLFSWKLFKRALLQGILKLNPVILYHNPVIFVTTLGAGLITFDCLFFERTSFAFSITVWLWFTVYFATFSEAFAEMRNQAQANALRSLRQEATANRITEEGDIVVVPVHALKKGDRVFVFQGEQVPADGEILVGSALLDESSFTGESEPVVRTRGTDFNSVMAGTKVLSDELFIKITSDPGKSYIDRMIHLIESTKRKKTVNEQALTILLNGLTAIFLITILSLKFFGNYFHISFSLLSLVSLFVCLIPTTIGGLLSTVGIAGIHRLMKKNVLAMSSQAVEAAGDVNVILFDKTGTITVGNRKAYKFIPAEGVAMENLVECALFTSIQDLTTEGRSIIEWIEKEYPHSIKPLPSDAQFIPFSAETRICGVDIGERSYRKGSQMSMENFIKKSLPYSLKTAFVEIAQDGGTPLVVGTHEKILGLIWLKDTIKPGIAEKFSHFRTLGIKTVMLTGDNALTAQSVANEVGVDRFIANISPEAKLKEINLLQHKGLIVAMTGDGVNDAPALAQADVAMAMNAGTQTAKEAANMIDLDSYPTKLFDVIEIGKQMLMTRGSLTTFSLTNDFSKYFVILPAILIPFFPFFASLNLMRLSSPEHAILSAVIYNALIIIALLPVACKSVKLVPAPATAILNRNLLIYGLSGFILPFIGIKLIDVILQRLFA